jgi:hypothetical protein
VVHGTDVIHHFADVTGSSWFERFRLELQDVKQRGLGPFDLTGQDGFLPDVHGNEQIRVG